ncbi:hypothetical protein [Nocardia sienata]|uniref:hypothetical protein n=1 Tax=Nocardia sienata TaxID=248552 RepID=UPI0007A3C5AE|nr:hypothetical protein [Nocardia sienata]
MTSEPTQWAAREQLYRYFVLTLRTLPVGSALALSHPELPHAHLHAGVTLPAKDFAAEFFDMAYWVIEAPSEIRSDYFELVVQSWNRFGWPTRTDRDNPPRAAYTRTPGHAGLSVRESVGGYVSLSGSTPPFAVGSPAGMPLPEVIEHPLTVRGTRSTADSPAGAEADPLPGRADSRWICDTGANGASR